jgi:UDP-GlcNAc:undecaprenyl-phosphate GlcNAc-1-phosphate transferase
VSFPSNLYVLSFLCAGLVTVLTLPLWRAWCRRTGLVDDPGHRKIHAEPIPLAGGLAILTGLLLPLLGAFAALKLDLPGGEAADKLAYGFERRFGQLAAIAGGAMGMALLGWLDDKHELRPSRKFAGQLLIAALVAAAGIRITLFVSSPVFSYAITILWILTVTNAFNFMDNMNGLCAGLAAIASLFIGLTAARHGHYLVAAMAFLALGASLGFLPFNFPRASAFLGDAGSHLLGFLVSVLAILPHYYSADHPHALAVLSPLLILAVPLADLVWVVLLRWRMRKPFYLGDTNHLSHQLVRLGLSQARAVLAIWALAAAVGGLVFLL